MIKQEDLWTARNARLQKLISALEDQDKMLEVIIRKMPKSGEKQDLIEIKDKVVNLMGEVDRVLYNL